MKMYLSGQESASYMMKNQFNINGAYLTASNNTPGYQLYRSKFHREVSLEEDPNFKCRNYPKHGDYAKVKYCIICFTKLYLKVFSA